MMVLVWFMVLVVLAALHLDHPARLDHLDHL